MDPEEKKVALRAVTYGLSVMTGSGKGRLVADGVNRLTQASFDPPPALHSRSGDGGTHLRGGPLLVRMLGHPHRGPG